MINKAWPGLPIRIASKIVLSAQGQDGCKRGATLTLDDVNMVSEGE